MLRSWPTKIPNMNKMRQKTNDYLRTQDVQTDVWVEDGQTTQWPKDIGQNDKQRSTKHTHKTKDRVTRTQLKTVGELRCSGSINSSCSTSGTHRVNLVTNPVIRHG